MLYRLRALLLAGALAAVILFASPAPADATHVREVQQKRTRVVKIAKRYLGKPYSWGASGPSAFDCSGFTSYVYRKVGVSLPHNAAAQDSATRRAYGKLRRGDLLYFYGDGHVGIYIGKGRFIHASSSRGRVVITRLSGWYRWHLSGTGRVLYA